MAELIAFVGIWALWDFRVAATFALIVIVWRAVQDELPQPPAPPEPPTLRDSVEPSQRPRG